MECYLHRSSVDISSMRVLPLKLCRSGYQFRFPKNKTSPKTHFREMNAELAARLWESQDVLLLKHVRH